ncbi:unnamed protein product, partial [Lymnaea stagnalis]
MSLAELVSVTGNAVKSLSESEKTNYMDAQDGPKLITVSKNGCPKGLFQSQNIGPLSTSLKGKPQAKESDGDVNSSSPVVFSSAETSAQVQNKSDGELSENVTVIEIRSVNEHNGHSKASSSREGRTVTAFGISQTQKDSKTFRKAQSEIKAVSPDLEWSSNKSKKEDEYGGSTDLRDSFNGQPEIIDVHEHIIAITSGMSGSEEGSVQSEADEILQEQNSNDDYFRTHPVYPKAKSKTLKQGIQDKGTAQFSKSKAFDDIFISQFELTEKQRSLKQALAKRGETNKPKKKFVQSKIIQSKVASEKDTAQDSHNFTNMAPPSADPAVAAAVAASAAVAATQPFLKVQHELESKIQLLLAQLSELQEKKSAPEGEKTSESEERIQWLEKQMAELNERRMEHLENLQQRQLQMQAQLLYMSRSRTRSPGSHVALPTRQPPPSRIPQAVMKQRGQIPLQPDQPSLYKPYATYKTQPGTEAQSQPYYN